MRPNKKEERGKDLSQEPFRSKFNGESKKLVATIELKDVVTQGRDSLQAYIA